ncbi:MAG: N-acetyltransferase [Planctomycetota bacterium]
MTTTSTNMLPLDSGTGPILRRATGRLLPRAAQCLVAATAGADPSGGRRFLEAASAHSIDLRTFWVSVDRKPVDDVPSVRQAVLAVPGAGRTAVLFTSQPSEAGARAELARVIERACEDLEQAVLAQVLLSPSEEGAAPSFDEAGFERVARLAYLRRPTPMTGQFRAPAADSWPDAVRVERGVETTDDEWLIALDRTYDGTLDCPRLCGLRDTADVLISHRAAGTHSSDLWWMIRVNGEPHGVMIFAPNTDQSSIELVYVGLSPRLRGCGLGDALMCEGLAALASRPEASISCAVDLENVPARRLYERFGFVEFGRRLAMVRRLGGVR